MEEELNHLAFFSIIRVLVGPNYSDKEVQSFEVEIFLGYVLCHFSLVSNLFQRISLKS